MSKERPIHQPTHKTIHPPIGGGVYMDFKSSNRMGGWGGWVGGWGVGVFECHMQAHMCMHACTYGHAC